MKKIIAMLLALVMVFALCACGSQPAAEQTQAPAAEEKAQEIEENVLAAFARQDAEEETEESAEEPAPADDYPEGDPFAREEPEEVSEPTRRLNLNDLKFGRNYKGE